MRDAPELKPFPFCGKMPKRVYLCGHQKIGTGPWSELWVTDHTCAPGHGDSPSSAARNWNRRADLVPAPSVTVKPLEWEDEEEQSYAFGAGAEYLVQLSHNGSWYYGDVVWPFATIDAAKAAAQADYETRIMAAIQIDPHQVACALCEDHPKAPNNPCAICGRASPDVTIPKGHPDLNLAAWIDRRREQVGPWADYIIAGVGKLEQEIAKLRSATPGWQSIKTAPRDQTVLLAWLYRGEWQYEAGLAGSTRGGWWHGQATHWMPLTAPPGEDKK